MQADTLRGWLIKKISANRFADVRTELVPSIGLSENIVCQALRAVASVDFLCDFEDPFGRGLNLRMP